MYVKTLESGFVHIRVSPQCWAQVPPGWVGPIPDEYIFWPAWNRERMNEASAPRRSFAEFDA